MFQVSKISINQVFYNRLPDECMMHIGKSILYASISAKVYKIALGNLKVDHEALVVQPEVKIS